MQVRCEKHGIVYENELKIGSLTIMRQCPQCLEEIDSEEKQKDEERQREIELAKYEAMNIEPMFYDATLDNFAANTPELKRAVEAIRRLISGEIQQIIMIGKNGTGKTHLAVAAVKLLGGRIYSMYEIATRIRATYTQRAHEDELDVVDELSRVPLLAIDELGRTKGSDAETNWLSYIIDKRHARMLPTIIISNKHLRKDCPVNGCDSCLENYISEDIMSRLTENGVLIKFTGEDWRKAGNKLSRK